MIFSLPHRSVFSPSFFFFNDTAPTEIYTLSLHDALPICCRSSRPACARSRGAAWARRPASSSTARSRSTPPDAWRSEEHTSELQSHVNLVCRLLLEKKKKKKKQIKKKKEQKNKNT